MLAHVKSLVGEHWPQNAEEYAAIGTIMGQFLVEIGLAVIPGSGIIDAFEAAEQDDYLAVTFALATVIADFFGGTIIKVVAKIGKVGYKSFKIFKLVYKYLANVTSAIADDIIKAVLNNDIVKLLSNTGDEIGKVVDNIMEISHHGIKAIDNSVIFRNADDVNLEFPPSWHPPYKAGKVVTEFVTSEAEQFVRVFKQGVNEPVGHWFVKASDIANMSPTQIQDFLSLPVLPDKLVTVDIPIGTRIRTGIAAAIDEFGVNGGAIQFEIPFPDLPNPDWFSNIINL